MAIKNFLNECNTETKISNITQNDAEILEVVMSYHKDLDKWFIDKLYLDGDGNCVACDSDDFSPSERNEYIKIGKAEVRKKFR